MKKVQHLKPLLHFFLIGLIINSLSRIILFFIFKDRVMETENYIQLFLIGLRFDIILLSYLSFLPFVLITFLPDNWLQKIKNFFTVYFTFFLFIMLLMELATPDFVHQYDTRPNRLFLDYLIYPKEVVGTLIKSYLGSLIVTFVVLGITLFYVFKKGKSIFIR